MATARRTGSRKASSAPVDDAAASPVFEQIAEVMRREGRADPVAATGKRGAFGADALKAGGKIFAMMVQGTLVVKLPATRVNELIAAGRGSRFETGAGRAMKEWVALNGGESDWLELAREACAFVSGGKR